MDPIECPNCKGKINLDQIDPGVFSLDRQIFLYRFDKILLSLFRIEDLLENIRSNTFESTKIMTTFFQDPPVQTFPESKLELSALKSTSELRSANPSSVSSAPEKCQDGSQSIDSNCSIEQKD